MGKVQNHRVGQRPYEHRHRHRHLKSNLSWYIYPQSHLTYYSPPILTSPPPSALTAVDPLIERAYLIESLQRQETTTARLGVQLSSLQECSALGNGALRNGRINCVRRKLARVAEQEMAILARLGELSISPTPTHSHEIILLPFILVSGLTMLSPVLMPTCQPYFSTATHHAGTPPATEELIGWNNPWGPPSAQMPAYGGIYGPSLPSTVRLEFRNRYVSTSRSDSWNKPMYPRRPVDKWMSLPDVHTAWPE